DHGIASRKPHAEGAVVVPVHDPPGFLQQLGNLVVVTGQRHSRKASGDGSQSSNERSVMDSAPLRVAVVEGHDGSPDVANIQRSSSSISTTRSPRRRTGRPAGSYPQADQPRAEEKMGQRDQVTKDGRLERARLRYVKSL